MNSFVFYHSSIITFNRMFPYVLKNLEIAIIFSCSGKHVDFKIKSNTHGKLVVKIFLHKIILLCQSPHNAENPLYIIINHRDDQWEFPEHTLMIMLEV